MSIELFSPRVMDEALRIWIWIWCYAYYRAALYATRSMHKWRVLGTQCRDVQSAELLL